MRERSSTIVTSKYGTSTGIHKIDRYDNIGWNGGGGDERAKIVKQCIKVDWGRGGGG